MSLRLAEMLLPGLGSIYHSPLCEEETKQIIINELLKQNAIRPDEKPLELRIIPPPKNINLKKFIKIMAEHMKLYSALEKEE